jgi:PKD repeat protein
LGPLITMITWTGRPWGRSKITNASGNQIHQGARVSNGRIVSPGNGVNVDGSDCVVSGLNITIGGGGIGFNIEHGQYNRIQNCVVNAPNDQPLGNEGCAAFWLFLASYNTIQNCVLTGVFVDTIIEDDQAGTFVTVVGDNTFTGIRFANPTP